MSLFSEKLLSYKTFDVQPYLLVIPGEWTKKEMPLIWQKIIKMTKEKYK
jgi:hypothetical protein